MSQHNDIALSVLDLSKTSYDGSPKQALLNTLDLASFVDNLGYSRYWITEHHNSQFFSCSSPEILISQLANVTKKIRIGAGGIMLPNHSVLKIAENFRTLEIFHPQRIDLGVGKSVVSDFAGILLRGHNAPIPLEKFNEDIDILHSLLSDALAYKVIASPTGGGIPKLWVLGTSGESYKIAAEFGLGYVFGYHINPNWEEAIRKIKLYQEMFKPSVYFKQPHPILTISVICATTDERARELAFLTRVMWLNLNQGKKNIPLSMQVVESMQFTTEELSYLQSDSKMIIIGSPKKLTEQLITIARAANVKELMINTETYDHTDRKLSYELLARAFYNNNIPHLDR